MEDITSRDMPTFFPDIEQGLRKRGKYREYEDIGEQGVTAPRLISRGKISREYSKPMFEQSEYLGKSAEHILDESEKLAKDGTEAMKNESFSIRKTFWTEVKKAISDIRSFLKGEHNYKIIKKLEGDKGKLEELTLKMKNRDFAFVILSFIAILGTFIVLLKVDQHYVLKKRIKSSSDKKYKYDHEE